MRRILQNLKYKMKAVWKDTRGVSSVEIILILVVLIGLVLIFKSQLTSLVNNIFETIREQSGAV